MTDAEFKYVSRNLYISTVFLVSFYYWKVIFLDVEGGNKGGGKGV